MTMSRFLSTIWKIEFGYGDIVNRCRRGPTPGHGAHTLSTTQGRQTHTPQTGDNYFKGSKAHVSYKDIHGSFLTVPVSGSELLNKSRSGSDLENQCTGSG